jgi:hypothetical protein
MPTTITVQNQVLKQEVETTMRVERLSPDMG